MIGGNFDPDTRVHTLWIHNNNAEYALGAGCSHYSGLKANAMDPHRFQHL